ncbi:somatostatin receptor type 5-like [Diadema setosum]|uniref:somatostatin receptor type 5-like n=1 Tax=Diadema setosum TaxID=31175 RepID=UPI003B3AF900
MEVGNRTENITDGVTFDFYPHSVIISTVYISIIFVGILGNALVIVGVFVTPKLRTPTNVLIVNLAIADLLTCLALPFQTIGVLSPPNEFPLPLFVCSIIGGVIYVTFTCSAVNLLLIAIIRYYVITRSLRSSHGLNTRKIQAVFAVLAWILAVVYVMVPIHVFHLTEFSYYPGYRQCFTSLTDTIDIYHNYLAVLLGIHLLIIMCCYTRIVIFVKQHQKRFRVVFGSSCDVQGKRYRDEIRRLSKREVRVTKNLFTVVLAFVVCALPTIVSFLLPGVLVAGLYTTAILYCNNCINPILYAFKHPVFKKAFMRPDQLP